MIKTRAVYKKSDFANCLSLSQQLYKTEQPFDKNINDGS